MWSAAFWALAGNVATSTAQWAVVVLFAKVFGYATSGDYALALALVNPVMMLATLQLRAVQSSDAAGRFQFSDFLTLRMGMILAAIVVVFAIHRMTTASPGILGAVVAIKVFDLLSDTYQGALQQADRWEWIALAQISRAFLLLAGVAMGALLHQPVASLGLAAVGSALVLVGFERRRTAQLGSTAVGKLAGASAIAWKKLQSLIVVAWPLGTVTLLISIQQSIPRLTVEHFAGRELLGRFATTAAVALGLTLAVNAVGQAMARPLAVRAHRQDFEGFRQLLGRGMLASLVVGLAATVVSAALGETILRMLFGGVLPVQERWLTLQMAAASATALAGLCGFALTAMGHYRLQLSMFLPLTIVSTLGCWMAASRSGIEGICWVMLAASGLHLIVAGCLVLGKMMRLEVTRPTAAVEV